MPGFQNTTEATDEGFIIPSAPGWLPVYFLVARGTNFDPLLHGGWIIRLCLLTVKAEMRKRLSVEALAFHGRVPAFFDGIADRHVKVGGRSGLALRLLWPV